MPHVAIIGSSALLLIAALLNYIFPDATLVFTYVTTLSTVLFLIVWALIIVAYINYSRKNPKLHKESIYKLPGGKYMGYVILIFFILVFGLLFVNETTRRAIYLTPLWFILLGFMYWRYKRISKTE